MQLPTGNEKATATMADERTPLIQHVDVRPHRDRYPHHRLRLVCHTILSTVVIVGGLTAVVLFSLGSFDDHHESAPTLRQSLFSASQIPDGWLHKTTEGFEELQSILLNTPDAEQARESSKYYASGPHLAGKNLSQALWTMEKWQSYGIASSIVDYDVYINYPKGHRLALLGKSDKKDDSTIEPSEKEWEVTYEAKLEENVLKEDASSQLVDRVPTFHGYSASGNVTAPYVFVNYGTFQDFEDLRAANVSLEGKIALVKYFGGNFRGLKVKRAQEMGMIGCVMYSDPGDDGEITEEKGLKPYPDGPAREPSSVQRGSVQFLSMSAFC
jgi:N-acetylated-alpha-linked acidic dipeptidase